MAGTATNCVAPRVLRARQHGVPQVPQEPYFLKRILPEHLLLRGEQAVVEPDTVDVRSAIPLPPPSSGRLAEKRLGRAMRQFCRKVGQL